MRTWKKTACKLWDLLDNIDSASDIFKPDHTLFYKYVMKMVGERHELLRRDWNE